MGLPRSTFYSLAYGSLGQAFGRMLVVEIDREPQRLQVTVLARFALRLPMFALRLPF